MSEAAIGVSVNKFGSHLQKIDILIAEQNKNLHEALFKNADGKIKMSRNLDGNIAEHLIASTASLDAALLGKDIKEKYATYLLQILLTFVLQTKLRANTKIIKLNSGLMRKKQ